MKKILAWLLVVALTAAIAVGGTLAYLTDTDEDVNVMTLGNVKIDQLEYERVDVETKDGDAVVQEFHDNKPLYPAVIKDGFNWETDSAVDWSQIGKDGYSSNIWDPEKINNEQDKMVFVKNKGSYDAYVRSIFAFEANGYTLDQFKALFHLNINETDWTWKWEENPVSIPGAEGDQTTNYIVATATYNKALKPGELTEISLAQIALDPSAGNEDIAGFGESYQILVKTQAIQAEGFDSPDAALKDGFGDVAEKLPFENDSPIQGIDLRTALHYYEGDTTNQITKKVTNVIFGLNKDYPDVVDSYVGTLVDVEQDVPVHAYYVPNGSNYDVHFLASDDIYLPKDSTRLFYNMSVLEEVDSYNLNTSRTEIMKDMFKYCSVLKQVKSLGTWDTRSLVSTWDMFAHCLALETIEGMQNWNFDNALNLCGLFQRCITLQDDDMHVIENWDISNVEDISWMFKGCTGLVELDLSNWDTGNVKKFNSMFSSSSSNTGDMNLLSMGIENWDTSSGENMGYMFYGCGDLVSIDLSNWDVSRNTTFNHFFTDCYNLKDVNFSGWDTSNVELFAAMFNNCNIIEYLDLSDFDTQNAKHFDQMFEYCAKLKEIKGLENWNTSNVVSFYEMFSGCGSLTELNLSTFNTSNVADTFRNFNGCGNLKTIYVGDGWDMSNVTSYAAMFSGCNNLVGGNGTVFAGSDLKYACVDTAENPGYFTHINDKP